MIVYQGAPQQTKGGLQEVSVSDLETQQTLVDILKELRKQNIHMSFITDNFIDNTEVEV